MRKCKICYYLVMWIEVDKFIPKFLKRIEIIMNIQNFTKLIEVVVWIFEILENGLKIIWLFESQELKLVWLFEIPFKLCIKFSTVWKLAPTVF